MLRVLADTNLFISYLLRPGTKGGSIHDFFQALAEGKFVLLMPQDLIDEISKTILRKPHLLKVISADQLEAFTDVLKNVSEEIPRITDPIPKICRDPDDDYLLAYALFGAADYLVTGDKDLLVLKRVDNLKIVSLPQFQVILSE